MSGYTPTREDYIRVQGGKQYLPVPSRVQWFRGEHPTWGIITSIVELDWTAGYAVMRAEVIDDDGRVVASGMKTETRKGFGDFVEKAETGAVGRALARAGYGTEDALDLEDDRFADAPIQQLRGGERAPAERRAGSKPATTRPAAVPSSGRSRRLPAAAPEAGTDAPEQGEGSSPATPAPGARPRRSQDAADEESPDYWQRRIHAAAKERSIDHEGVRLIAAAVLGIAHDDLDAFSTTDMVPAEFGEVDAALRSLPEPVEGETTDAYLDQISTWVWPRANAKGLDAWAAIDAVVVAATGKQPDTLTVAEWVAWTLRLTRGEYDAQQGAA